MRAIRKVVPFQECKWQKRIKGAHHKPGYNPCAEYCFIRICVPGGWNGCWGGFDPKLEFAGQTAITLRENRK
jgi:hypothetical protein